MSSVLSTGSISHFGSVINGNLHCVIVFQASTLALIKEKLEWLESATEATTQDFINQRVQMEESLQPIIQKINEPRMYMTHTHMRAHTHIFNISSIEHKCFV